MGNSKKLGEHAAKSLVAKLSSKDIELTYFTSSQYESRDRNNRRDGDDLIREEHRYSLPDGTHIAVNLSYGDKG